MSRNTIGHLGNPFDSASSPQKRDKEKGGGEAGRGDGERGGKEEGEEEDFRR